MRDWPNPDLRRKLARQATSLAQSILDGKQPLVANAQRLETLMLQLQVERTDPIMEDLMLIASETNTLPLGTERQFWDERALEQKDRDIARAEMWAREFGLDTCLRITQRFDQGDRAT